MKKNIVRIAIGAMFCLAAGYSVYTAQKKNEQLSDVMLENVEALARDENPNCPNGCVSGTGGCRCNGYYPQYAEYTGW